MIPYFPFLNDIYNFVLLDIKKKYKNNNKISINGGYKNHNFNNKKFGLNHLYKWKFILKVLKLYIYSYYAIENFNFENFPYFSNKYLSLISIQLYFKFQQNSIFQNIFVEIIKIIFSERSPNYLVEPFLEINEEKGQNKLILKYCENLKRINNN